jgi:hypothetical protein
MNYFKNQFLHVEDFTAEQGYHLGMRRRHNRWLHSLGVAQGLELSYAPNGTAVTVGEGMAIDNQGREVVLVEDATLELADFEGGREVWVTIAYTEVPTKEQNETGVRGNTRVEERPELVGLLSKPAEGTRIILGRVERGGDNGTRITKVDSSVRTTAGAIEGDVLLTPRDPAVPADDYVTLKWSGAKQADLTGSLRVRRFSPTTADGNLNAEGSVAASGGLAVDQANRNAGDLGGASALVFGTTSGEGILSKRTAGANQFGLDLLTRGVSRLSISNAGNVGIGTGGAPAQVPLDVRGEARARTLTFSAPDGSVLPDAWLGLATNVDGTTRWLHVGGITDAGARRLAFFGDRLYVSGRVGLGVTAPTNRLHVADNTGIRQNRLFLSGGGGSGWSSLSFNAHHDAANTNWVFVEPASTAVSLEMDASAGFPRFDVFSTTAAQPTAWVHRFRIDGETGTTTLVPVSGSVGIGTPAPQAKLEVAGDIRWARSALVVDQGGSIELGGLPTTAGGGTPYIDFHFAGLTQDFNMRLVNDADRRLSLLGGNLYVAGGAVGVGTPAPRASLDVVGGTTTAAFRRGWGNWIELWKTDVNPNSAWFIHSPQAPNSALTIGFFDGTNILWGRLTLAPDGVLTVPSIACEPRQVPAFASGWGDYAGWSPVRFYKDPFGIVHLEGLATKHSGTPVGGETILTLPVGYRPSAALIFAVHAGEPNGVGRVDVHPDGRVVFTSGPVGHADYQSLSTVHFRAA